MKWDHAVKRATVSVVGAFLSHGLVDVAIPHHPPIGMILWLARTFIMAAGFLMAMTILYHWMDDEVN